jgi:hypothetical protein
MREEFRTTCLEVIFFVVISVVHAKENQFGSLFACSKRRAAEPCLTSKLAQGLLGKCIPDSNVGLLNIHNQLHCWSDTTGLSQHGILRSLAVSISGIACIGKPFRSQSIDGTFQPSWWQRGTTDRKEVSPMPQLDHNCVLAFIPTTFLL